ncbi:MAG: copper resistance protein CopC, partial [Actinomycetota bacterium]
MSRRAPTVILRPLVAVLVGIVALTGVLLGGASPVAAHDNIASSSPMNGDVLREPIDHVTIDFGEEISDSVQMFLRFEGTDGEVEQIGGEVTKTSPSVARLDFPLLEREGTYFVNYIGPVPSDGHVITGAIGFVLGAPTVLVSDDPNVISSTPFARETVSGPVTEVEIEFAAPVTNLRFNFLYDVGDGATFTPIEITQEQVADDTVVVRFEPLDADGTYILNYLGRYAQQTEEISGQVPFFLGAPSGESSPSFPWLPFGAVAAAVLAIGAWFSWRRATAGDADSEGEVDGAAGGGTG